VGFYHAALGTGRYLTHRFFRGLIDDVIVFSRGTNINLVNTDKVEVKTFR
jgi:hypothetical protein